MLSLEIQSYLEEDVYKNHFNFHVNKFESVTNPTSHDLVQVHFICSFVSVPLISVPSHDSYPLPHNLLSFPDQN